MRCEIGRHRAVVLGGVIGMAVQAVGYISLGTMMTPLAAATGWTRTQILVVAPFSAVLAPIVSPWIGSLLDRLGARRVAISGFALAAVGVSGLGMIGSSIVGWWLLWAIIAAATFPTGALVWTQIVTRTFTRSRGAALGIVLSGMGLAAATVPLFLGWAITALGWRRAYLVLGLLILILGTMATLIASRGESQMTEEKIALLPVSTDGMTRGQAIRTRQFWQLGLILLLASGAVGSLAIHLQSMLIDGRASMLTAAAIASAFGPAQIVGRVGAGFLLDRVHGGFLGAIVFLAPVAGCLMLLGGVATGSFYWIAPVSFGLAAGLELDLGSYLASRYFGVSHFASIFSGLFVFHVVGYTFAPLAAAYIRDTTGSYAMVVVAIVIALPVVALLSATLGRYPMLAADA